MEIEKLSKNYSVRRLGEEHVEKIFTLSCNNEIFYQYHPPFVTRESIMEDMAALPPGKSYEDKYYVGFFDGATLIAIMDLVLGFPTKEIAFFGLFMMDTRFQNQGIGTDIVQNVALHLGMLGYQEIRLGVDKENPQSNAFWRKNGFSPITEEKYVIMRRILS